MKCKSAESIAQSIENIRTIWVDQVEEGELTTASLTDFWERRMGECS
jgi:hypothetical protein